MPTAGHGKGVGDGGTSASASDADHHHPHHRAGVGSKAGYPTNPADYKILEEVGQGVSAVVYKAKCLPHDEVVAIKSLDLEKCNSSLEDIRKEAQMMSMINHPNLVKAHCSFANGQFLWVVMPFMEGGSCLHIMKSHHPDGLEEVVIATILKETLKALDYLHRHGHIHRDVKAGNILIDGSGCVKLADFGVSACMFDTGDRLMSRKTFVGTPCWMAPEVLEQLHGYDFKADIWSFGITALELAHGHAPFSKFPPLKVLLMTLQGATPGLDYERDKKFSKAFKEMIAMCLVKDPNKRPTAEKLLKHTFFKQAKSSDYICKHLLDGLPPIGDRVRILKAKDEARLAAKKVPMNVQEERSQNEYKLGVSGWNFNVEDLKKQASILKDDDDTPSIPEDEAMLQDEASGATPAASRRPSDVDQHQQQLHQVGPGGALAIAVAAAAAAAAAADAGTAGAGGGAAGGTGAAAVAGGDAAWLKSAAADGGNAGAGVLSPTGPVVLTPSTATTAAGGPSRPAADGGGVGVGPDSVAVAGPSGGPSGTAGLGNEAPGVRTGAATGGVRPAVGSAVAAAHLQQQRQEVGAVAGHATAQAEVGEGGAAALTKAPSRVAVKVGSTGSPSLAGPKVAPGIVADEAGHAAAAAATRAASPGVGVAAGALEGSRSPVLAGDGGGGAALGGQQQPLPQQQQPQQQQQQQHPQQVAGKKDLKHRGRFEVFEGDEEEEDSVRRDGRKPSGDHDADGVTAGQPAATAASSLAGAAGAVVGALGDVVRMDAGAVSSVAGVGGGSEAGLRSGKSLARDNMSASARNLQPRTDAHLPFSISSSRSMPPNLLGEPSPVPSQQQQQQLLLLLQQQQQQQPRPVQAGDADQFMLPQQQQQHQLAQRSAAEQQEQHDVGRLRDQAGAHDQQLASEHDHARADGVERDRGHHHEREGEVADEHAARDTELAAAAAAAAASAVAGATAREGERDVSLDVAHSAALKGRFSVAANDMDSMEDALQQAGPREGPTVDDWDAGPVVAAGLYQQAPTPSAQLLQGPPAPTAAGAAAAAYPSSMGMGGGSNHFLAAQVPLSSILPHLNSLIKHAAEQQDAVYSLMNSLTPADSALRTSVGSKDSSSRTSLMSTGDLGSSAEVPTERERDLMQQVAELQSRLVSLQEELSSLKVRNVQLERQLNVFYNKEEEERIRKEEAARGEG